MQLKGLNILVTGSAKRVGKEIALTLARKGANVLVHYNTSKKEALETVEEILALGVKSFAFQADHSDAKQVKALIDFTVEKLGSIDILINSASSFKRIEFSEISEKDIVWNFDNNLKGPFLCALEASKHMLKQKRGKIINIIDWATERPYSGYLSYLVAKGGLRTLTLGLARELAPFVQVLGINPGPMLAPEFLDEKRKKEIAEKNLLKKWGSPKDIANTVAFLIEGTDFMTGEIVNVDGGSAIQGFAPE